MTAENHKRQITAAAVTKKEDEILGFIADIDTELGADPRWLAIARTDLERSFMALRRAVFAGKRVSDST